MAGSADQATTRSSMDDEDQAAAADTTVMAGPKDQAATFDPDQAAAEADQILARRRSRAAASGAKVRMPESELNFIMSMQPTDIPDNDDDALELLSRSHPDLYTPEVVEERRREHQELVAMFRRDDEEIAARQAEVMTELGEKGYVEVEEIDQTYVDEFNEWGRLQWERLQASSSERLSRLRIPTDEEQDEAFRNFLRMHPEEVGEEEEDYYYYSDNEDENEGAAAAATVESSDSLQTDHDGDSA